MARRTVATGLALLLLIAACGGDPPPPPREPTPLDLETTGTISGEVRFEGPVPAMREINFGSFLECRTAHDGPVMSGEMLVADGRVQNAFVYVKSGLGDRVFAIPTDPVVIDQHGCIYEPRVAGAQVGQEINYVNSDRTLHNVHGTPGQSRDWNFALSRQGANRSTRISAEEIAVSVRCDLHPWMQGWIGVVDHPYHAVTGADGRFALEEVPPGTYVIGVWHERLGTSEHTVELPAKGAETVTLTLG